MTQSKGDKRTVPLSLRFSDYVDSNGKRGGDKAVAIQNNFIIYVYGPNGEMRRFNPTTNEDITLYGDLPKSAKKLWQN